MDEESPTWQLEWMSGLRPVTRDPGRGRLFDFDNDAEVARHIAVAGMSRFFKRQTVENDKHLGEVTQELYYAMGYSRPRVVLCDSPDAFLKAYTDYVGMYRWEQVAWARERLAAPGDFYPGEVNLALDLTKAYAELSAFVSSYISQRSVAMAADALSAFYRLLITPCFSQGLPAPVLNAILPFMGTILLADAIPVNSRTPLSWQFRDYHGYAPGSMIECLMTLIRNSFFFAPMRDVCFIVRMPVSMAFEGGEARLEAVNLHNPDGPVFEFRDGNKVYMWKNVRVPEYAITDPSKITVKEVLGERNVALRRVLIERYGFPAFMLDAGARIIDRYEGDIRGLQGALLYELQFLSAQDETMKMVSVVDCTPENGEYKTYFLRVPPNMRSVLQAVAWTWGMTPEQYNPIIES